MTGADVPDHVELTTREREVLAMLVEGKTNREIGAALFISESTAGVHVSNILAKLGVASRTEAAALAAQAGLAGTAPPPPDEVADVSPDVAEAPLPPRPTGWRDRLRAQMRRHPTSTAIAVGGVVVLAALTTGLAFAVLTSDRPTGAVDPSSTPIGLASDEAASPTPTALGSGSPTPAASGLATPSPTPSPSGTPAATRSPIPARTSAPVAQPTPTPNLMWRTVGTVEIECCHTANLLADGSVLVAGGWPVGCASVRRFLPDSESWTMEEPMDIERCDHTATPLVDGRILVAGGGSTATTEAFDPDTGAWSATGNLSEPRWLHTATRLADGRVLVVGGIRPFQEGADLDFTPIESAEVFDPQTGTWTTIGGPTTPRYGHTATLLESGAVLVAGGRRGCCGALSSAELFDPATQGWNAADAMVRGREHAAALLLPDGRVLVAGGGNGGEISNESVALASAEVYEPAADAWSAVSPMHTPRWLVTLTLLDDARVLAIGGDLRLGLPSDTLEPDVEVYDISRDAWTFDGTVHLESVNRHTATLLEDGTVLVLGGDLMIGDVGPRLYIPRDLR